MQREYLCLPVLDSRPRRNSRRSEYSKSSTGAVWAICLLSGVACPIRAISHCMRCIPMRGGPIKLVYEGPERGVDSFGFLCRFAGGAIMRMVCLGS